MRLGWLVIVLALLAAACTSGESPEPVANSSGVRALDVRAIDCVPEECLSWEINGEIYEAMDGPVFDTPRENLLGFHRASTGLSAIWSIEGATWDEWLYGIRDSGAVVLLVGPEAGSEIHDDIQVLADSVGEKWIGDEAIILDRVGRPLEITVSVQVAPSPMGRASISDHAGCNTSDVIFREAGEALVMDYGVTTAVGCIPESKHDEDDAARDVLRQVQDAFSDGELLVLTVPWGEVRLRRES